MANNSTYKQNILSLFGSELGHRLLLLIDTDCTTPTPEDCKDVTDCETLTTLINSPTNTNTIVYTGEDGIPTNITLNNKDLTSLSYNSNTSLLTANISDGSTRTVSLSPLFTVVDTNSINMSYSSGIVAATVIVDNTIGDNTLTITANGLYVPPGVGGGGGSGDMILASAQINTGVKTFLDTTFKLKNVANTFSGSFLNTNTADRVYTLQDSDGTLAFLSDLSGYSPIGHTHVIADVTDFTDNSINWDTAYTNRITSLTTTGSSGASTLLANVLNIPNYTLAGLGGTTDHTALSNIGTNTHAQIDTHITDLTIHRTINDVGVATTDLWSASKITSELSGKSNTGHTHVEADITDLQAYGFGDFLASGAVAMTGDFDAGGNNIVDLGDVTFRTGATGGTIRTGTSAADKFILQGYKTGAGAGYVKLIEVDAGDPVRLQVIADYLEFEDATDETKKLNFSLSGATTATTSTFIFAQTADRNITFQDAAGTVAYLTDIFSPSTLLADYGFTDNSTNWNTAFGWGDHAGLYSLLAHTHTLADVTDVTATATEVNLLDLSGLTAGWVLSADSATTASWKAPTGGGVTDHTLLTNIGTNTHAQIDTHIADSTIHFTQAAISITESQISNLQAYLLNINSESIADLSDVVSATNTNRFVLVANGTTGYVGRALVEADISDLGTYSTDIHANIAALDLVSGSNTGDQTITLTGDVTGTGTGSFAATIANDAVTYAKMQNSSVGFTVLGKAATGAGDFAEIVAAADGVLRRSGSGNVAFGSLVTNNYSNSSVTLAKMANVATGTVFYRKTAGTGAPQVQTLATLKTDLGLTGTNSGDQTITLTGDVTGTGTGSFATTIGTGAVDIAMLSATGTPDATTFLRGDNTWATPTGSGDMILASAQTVTGAKTFNNGTLLLDDTSSAFNLVLASTSSTFSANRTLTFNLTNDSWTLSIQDTTTLNGGVHSGTNTGDQTSIVGITGTKAEFDTALTDDDFAYIGQANLFTEAQEIYSAAATSPLLIRNNTTYTGIDFRKSVIGTSAMGRISIERTDSPSGSDSKVHLWNSRSGVLSIGFTLDTDGSLQATDYGLGNITGTVAYFLGVDASGNIIEEAIPAGTGDMVLASAQTNTGAKTFNDTTLLLRNVANTFNGSFTNTNTADRVYTLPDSSGTISLDTHTHLLAAGATDVTATATELNLLDLSGLTAGWVLSADTATTASWKAPTGGGTSTLAGVSTASTTVGNSLYTMTTGIDVEFETSANATLLYLDEAGSIGVGMAPDTSATFHVGDGNTVAASLLSTDYLLMSYQNVAAGFNNVVASNTASHRPVFKGTRARGTLAAPTVPSNGDDVMSFLGAIFEGSTNIATAGVLFQVDGTVSAGVAPQQLAFATNETNSRTNRLTIRANGDIEFNKYGTASVTGTAAYMLAVDATGKVIEEALPTGGGTIGGSITNDQIAVGAATSDEIEGSTALTFASGLLKSDVAVTLGTGNLFQIDNNAVTRTRLTSNGAQLWNIYNGTAEAGSIQYSTPGGTPGIIYLGSTGLGRSQMFLTSDSGGLSWGAGTTASNPGTDMTLDTNGNLALVSGDFEATLGNITAYDGFVTGTTSTTVAALTGTTYDLDIASDGVPRIGVHTANNTPGTRGSIQLIKSRGTSASPTVLVAEDQIGDFSFIGRDSVGGYQLAAMVQAIVDGTPGSGTVPMRLSFITGSNFATREERLAVYSDGSLAFPDYGTNTFTGTATYMLAVDASGNLIEEALPSAEVNDLTAAVTWANVPDANITQSSVTQHQAALAIAETQITGLRGEKSVTIPDPVATDDATLFRTKVAITITDIDSHITGTTNVVFNIQHASTRTGTPIDVFTSDITLTSTAGQTNNSGFNDATIPAGSWVWVNVVSVSGTPTMFHTTVNYTED